MLKKTKVSLFNIFLCPFFSSLPWPGPATGFGGWDCNGTHNAAVMSEVQLVMGSVSIPQNTQNIEMAPNDVHKFCSRPRTPADSFSYSGNLSIQSKTGFLLLKNFNVYSIKFIFKSTYPRRVKLKLKKKKKPFHFEPPECWFSASACIYFFFFRNKSKSDSDSL